VPITAKLSKAFYDKVGEQATNELVDWFNQVDATYRADLRILNEQNFARFDAKVEQRIEALRAQLEAKLESVTSGLVTRAQLEGKLEALEAKFEAKLEAKITSATSELVTRAQLDSKIEATKFELIKWMFVFWTGAVLAGRLLR